MVESGRLLICCIYSLIPRVRIPLSPIDNFLWLKYNILVRGIVVQLVRAPPCHGGRCGFESRQSRLLFVKIILLFQVKSCYNKVTVNTNLKIDKHYDRAILIWNRFRYDPSIFSRTICCCISTIPSW